MLYLCFLYINSQCLPCCLLVDYYVCPTSSLVRAHIVLISKFSNVSKFNSWISSPNQYVIWLCQLVIWICHVLVICQSLLIFFAIAYIDIFKNYLKISNVFKSNISGGDVIWLYYTTICFKCFLFGMINQIETMKTGNNELLSMYWHAGIDHCISANWGSMNCTMAAQGQHMSLQVF